MDIDRIAPELRAAVRRMPRLPFGSRWGRGLIRWLLRVAPMPRLEGVTLDHAHAGAVALRLYRPHTCLSGAVLLWIHGGGYVIGRAAQDDLFCAETAAAMGALVVSVDYRLAPEHSFPDPLDDCLVGWRWLLEAADALDIDPARIAIGGQSAGAGLAACLVQRLYDEGPGRPAAQWLFCPMLDDRTAARPGLNAINHRIWNNRNNAAGWRAYLAAEPGTPVLPAYAVAARREDLRGLPPAWIGVGDVDLFYEEDRTYADRLRDAGVETQFTTVPGAPHGFEAWAAGSGTAHAYLANARAWLAHTLGGANG